MSIFQFVWQIIAICALIALLIYALVSAPWYILGLVLVGALVLAQLLMPDLESCAEASVDSSSSEPLPEDSSELSAGSVDKPTTLLYRGAHYSCQDATGNECSTPAVLSYRGAHYSTETHATDPEHLESESELDHRSIQPPALKYRGVKVYPHSS